jgi:cytochrome b
MSSREIKVWDWFVRGFHWSLVVAFAVAYLTEDDFMSLHVYAGYTIAGLISLRVIWGFIGSRYARFGSFVKSPAAVWSYMKDVAGFRAKRYLGHNPAGGAMIMALIVSLSMTLLFGLLTYAAVEFSGPLAGFTAGVGDSTAHVFKEIHEFFANLTLVLVVFHVAGVLVAGLQHGENLVRSMITGRKEIDAEEKLEVQK